MCGTLTKVRRDGEDHVGAADPNTGRRTGTDLNENTTVFSDSRQTEVAPTLNPAASHV